MQSLTVGESKTLMLKYIDEYSHGGELLAADQTGDYLVRHNAFADMVQLALAQLFPPAASYPIQQQPLVGLLAAGGFGRHDQPLGGRYLLSGEPVGAYYLEAAGELEIFFEGQVGGTWQPFLRLSQQGSGFQTHQDNLPPLESGRACRLRIESDCPYQLRNAALYAARFADRAAVPECRPWRRYRMPVDFMRLDRVICEEGEGYAAAPRFRWENERTLVLPHDQAAELTVHYWRYPPRITEATADSEPFALAPEVAQLIPLKVAALVIPTERADLSLRLLQLYEQELARLQGRRGLAAPAIERIYQL